MVPFPMTLNDPKPKVTPLFNAEYLRKGANMFYSEILIGTYALLKSVISNDLE